MCEDGYYGIEAGCTQAVHLRRARGWYRVCGGLIGQADGTRGVEEGRRGRGDQGGVSAAGTARGGGALACACCPLSRESRAVTEPSLGGIVSAGNGLGPEGGAAVAEALKVNKTLHTLFLDGECGAWWVRGVRGRLLRERGAVWAHAVHLRRARGWYRVCGGLIGQADGTRGVGEGRGPWRRPGAACQLQVRPEVAVRWPVLHVRCLVMGVLVGWDYVRRQRSGARGRGRDCGGADGQQDAAYPRPRW